MSGRHGRIHYCCGVGGDAKVLRAIYQPDGEFGAVFLFFKKKKNGE